jgi:hypothetical protein
MLYACSMHWVRLAFYSLSFLIGMNCVKFNDINCMYNCFPKYVLVNTLVRQRTIACSLLLLSNSLLKIMKFVILHVLQGISLASKHW